MNQKVLLQVTIEVVEGPAFEDEDMEIVFSIIKETLEESFSGTIVNSERLE